MVYPTLVIPGPSRSTLSPTALSRARQALLPTVALDCEMVGVIDKTQRNTRGQHKVISALGECTNNVFNLSAEHAGSCYKLILKIWLPKNARPSYCIKARINFYVD